MMQRIRRKILILRPCFAPSSEDEISPSEELVVEDDIYSDDYEQVKPDIRTKDSHHANIEFWKENPMSGREKSAPIGAWKCNFRAF